MYQQTAASKVKKRKKEGCQQNIVTSSESFVQLCSGNSTAYNQLETMGQG